MIQNKVHFLDLEIAITFEPKVVDPYNLGDSWSVDQYLSSGKSVPFFRGEGPVGDIPDRAHSSV